MPKFESYVHTFNVEVVPHLAWMSTFVAVILLLEATQGRSALEPVIVGATSGMLHAIRLLARQGVQVQ